MSVTIQDEIRQAASQYGVDPAIALAVAQTESGFNQGARGAAGEVGIFQLMPGTAGDLGVDPYSLPGNIKGGIAYLSQLYRQFGDWTKALAAYNGGPGNMARGTTPDSSWQYANNVLSTATLYGGTPLDQGADVTQASMLPDVSGVPTWAWFVLGSVVVAALVLRRD